MREGQFPALVRSFPLYLPVYKVVMVAACSVRQMDFCTMLQFIGQRADKWIPPSPTAPNVSHRRELGRSQA